MKCTISFRNLEHTDALDQKINEKSKKLEKFLGPDAKVEWVCWVENSDQFAEVKVNDGKNKFIAKANSNSLYSSLDLVLGKITSQIGHKH
ncbi:HPF/RaiA family ribosome-associated protein [Halobacteriovorax sp. HLS]|uniref:HPF/RaiA family ribosome-associated protein n=1 Tax=Halobacteriovorax sp. HLS TaxID=2234000 RepID=UPI000FD94896|nr:HPF/RaiA family ribosome-associated protein [Halobacteriovorax sp. HLS]